MQILDDKVFCLVAAKWKNLIKGYAWTTRPHKTFNILQDQISELKFIHNFTTQTCTNRWFPFHLSPSPHSANSTSMWKPGNAENNHCWNHLVHWKYSYLSVVHLHSKSQKENTELSNMQFRVPSSLASCDHGRCTGDSQLDHLQHTKAKPETQWASHLGRKTSISWFLRKYKLLQLYFHR